MDKESVAARAYENRNNKNDTSRQANEAREGEEARARERAEEEAWNRAEQIQNQQSILRGQLQNANSLKGTASKLKKLSSFRSWMLIGVVINVYIWQFIFALMSLVGFGAHALVLDFAQHNFVGKLISFAINLEKISPGQYLGWAMWGAAALLTVGTFIAYLMYYYAIGIKVFDTTMSTFLTFMCFIMAFLPVTNLFPWLIMWIVYINTRSITSLFTSTLSKK